MMKNIISSMINGAIGSAIGSMKAVLRAKTCKKEQVRCNYSNNYYGDQYCQPKRT